MTVRVTGMRVLAATLLAIVPAQSMGRSVEYRPFKLFNSGFRDKVTAPARWRISASSQFGASGKALEVAMYRGALLAKRAGFSHLQVVKAHLEFFSMGMAAQQIVKLDIAGVRSGGAPLRCENKKRNVHLCRTWLTEDLVQQGGRALGHTATEMAEDYAATLNRPR